jgi:2-hydroxy-3-oxopropionate reductase
VKIGFIGLGIMGKPMAKNLLKARHELVVFDVNKENMADVVAAGGKGASFSSGGRIRGGNCNNHAT